MLFTSKISRTIFLIGVTMFLYSFKLVAQKNWVGSSGGTWNTAGNWNPSGVPTASDDVVINGFTGNISVDVNANAKSLTVSGSSDVTLKGTTTSRSFTINCTGCTSTIESGSKITFGGSVATNQVDLAFSNSPVFTINGDVFLVDASKINFANSTTTLNGTLKNSGTDNPSGGTTSTLTVGATGVFEIAKNGGTVPDGSYNSSSTIKITGMTSSGPTFSQSTYGNLEINNTGQTGSFSFSGSTASTFNSINIVNTNGKDFRVTNTSAKTLTLNADFTSPSSTNVDLSSGAGVGTLQIKGNVQIDGTLTESGSSTTSKLELLGSSNQSLSIGTISNTVTVTMNNSSGATLQNALVFPSASTLTLTSGNLSLGSYNLTINGTVSGGSSSSYIQTNGTGAVTQTVGSSAKSFLVGNSSYNPITSISNTGTSDNFSVRVLDDVYDGGASGNILTTDVVDRTWEIVEGTASGSTISLTCQWNASEELSNFARTQCYISNYISGTDWNSSSTGAAGGADPYTRTRTNISNLSYFAIASGGVLPIELSQINAKAFDFNTLITWQTATEKENNYFAIERSANGQSYQEIGQVKGAGTSYEPKDYTYTDERPLPGKNYYRLRQVDYDGKYSYSPVVTAVFGAPRTLTLAPVPASESLSLQLEKSFDQDGKWQVFDLNGRLLLDGEWPAETKEQTLDVSGLPEGAYVLRFSVGQEVFVSEFWRGL